MTRARKTAITEAAEPTYEGTVADAINNLADAVRTLAGTMAGVAAGAHTDSTYNQRSMTAVIYLDAQERFKEVTRKLNAEQKAKLTDYIEALCRGKTKR